jgi:hypothetical protein
MMADILVRFVGIPMKDGKLTNEQSQLLVAIVLPSAPEIGEVVMINKRYLIFDRRTYGEANATLERLPTLCILVFYFKTNECIM